MPLAKTQKASSLTAHHGPSVARDALLKAYAPIASGFVSNLRAINRPFLPSEGFPVITACQCRAGSWSQRFRLIVL